MNSVALDTLLNPFMKLFEEANLNEILINSPTDIWIDKNGIFEKRAIDFIDINYLTNLANVIAQYTAQFISAEKPLLSASLSNGLRVQIVFKPICGTDNIVMSIRNNYKKLLTIDTLNEGGTFNSVSLQKKDTIYADLQKNLTEGKYIDFIKSAVENKKNILISGGASSGKTTLLNACLNHINTSERIITIEDVNEITLPNHLNKLHMIASRGQGVSQVSTINLIEASLRLRPDRIIVGELNGEEGLSFLRAINTGHTGSLATIHANSAVLAIEQLKLMIMQNNSNSLTMKDIHDYIYNMIDIIIHMKKNSSGARYIEEIWLNPTKIS